MSQKRTVILTMLLILVVAYSLVSAAAPVDQASVLNGKVTATVSVGAVVREGDVLVSVETLMGAAPAVRATVTGVVREILVKPGAMVKQGEVVARIEPTGK